MRPWQITAPAELPVTLAELKRHAVVDFSDDDDLLNTFLAAAVENLDGPRGVLGRCLVSQTWAVPFDCWSDRLRLPFPDVSAVTVSYADADGIEQVMTAADYELKEDYSGAFVRILPGVDLPSLYDDAVWPVTVEVTAGYGQAADVPAPIKSAIMVNAARLYEGRTGGGDLAMSLVSPYRWGSL